MVSITSKSLQVAARAMAIADEAERNFPSFTSIPSEPAEINRGISHVHLLEDMAWADSCLINDPDISHIDWQSWNSFRNAWSKTLSSETDYSAARIGNPSGGAVMEISPSSQQIGSSHIPGKRADGGDSSITEGAAPDSKEGVDFPGSVMEQSTVDIFKVWDLGILAEEDEFIDHLNKALAQSSLEASPSVSDDFELLKGLEDIDIDDIISGISDLSLNRS